MFGGVNFDQKENRDEGKKFGGLFEPTDFSGKTPRNDKNLNEIKGMFKSLDMGSYDDRRKEKSGFGRTKRQSDETDNEKAEQMSMMAAMGLQGLLMMDSSGMKAMDVEGQTCMKEILWTPEQTPKGLICSKLPLEYRRQIRELMMMVLRKEIPKSFFEMDWLKYGMVIQQSGVLENVAKIAMTKMLLPVTSSDVKEVMKPMIMLVQKMEKLETVPAKKNVFNIFTSLVSAIDKEEIYEQLAEIIQEVQSVFILKKETPFMTGVVGAPPETKALCKAYATHTADVAAKRDQMEMLSLPTIWEEKEGTVYKGDFCPLMGKWFWSPIAKCSCSQNKCGGVGHNQSDRKENL